MAEINNSDKDGFTLIELLVVIAIIGLLSTLSILALNQARARARDARRISDVKQISKALEIYYNESGNYPASIIPNQSITYDGYTFLSSVPVPPSPIDGSSCPTTQAVYTYTRFGSSASSPSYTINFCLGANIASVTGNMMMNMTPAGIFTGDVGSGSHMASPS
ncbi:MAG: prepilin-type N-terminal cleavage/methylation domain-containing protein [Candidatus Falkowbacteria bacterium]|nr:MAG: prepilin-type N-terminal cleavage/methylation domain-containing protein [Candidatus Falkowbacteria bacterium]